MTATLNDEVAELRRANAELQRRLDEALAREAATAEVLQVIKSSPGDLAPVFDAILQKATRLCGAATGHVVIFDGEMVKPVAVQGDPGFVEWVRQRRIHPLEPSSIADRMRQGESTVHIPDSTDTDLYRTNPTIRELIDRSGVRTTLGVALRKDNVLLGGIFVTTREVRPFTDKQVALLQNFAAQAVIAIENARLLTETREALEQQTATAEVLQVINGSPGDLAPVFDAMLEKAVRLCDAAFGTLFTYGGDSFLAVALHDVPAAFAAILAKPVHPSAGGALDRLLHGEGSAHFADVSVEDAYATGPDARRMVVELGGARSLLAVPLRKEDEFLGAFVVYRQEVRPFTDKQIALLENFAAQAVIAIENARLITETREALEQQTATAEVLQVINSSPGDLAPVFEAILEQAHQLCGAAFGALNIYAGDKLSAVAVRGLVKPFAERVQSGFIPSHTHPASALKEGAPFVQVPDIAEVNDPMARAAFEVGGLRTVLFIPLRQRERLLGNIVAARPEVRPFSDKQIALLQNFAAQAVIAMENARLLTETREALEQQTATAEVLQVINSSPGDLKPVFDAVLEKAHSLCGVAFGALELHDGGKFRAVALRGLSDPLAELLHHPHEPTPGSPLSRLLGGERIVQITDMAELAKQHPDDLGAQAGAEYGLRTVLFVPLRKDGALLGHITAGRLDEVRRFSDKEIALLENFAAQAVIAMENARLLTETREALEQQTATAEVLQVINSSPGDLAPVFDAILEKAHTLCGADYGSLLTYDGERFWPIARHGAAARLAEGMREGIRPWAGGGLDKIVRGEEPFAHIHDMAELAKMAPDDALARTLVEIGGIRTTLVVPLRKDNALHGVITANRREVRPFTDKQIALLQNFAAQAVIAMENARLLTETREALEQQTATAEVLQVINSSPGDLAPVFEAILERGHSLCGIDFGALQLHDGGKFRSVAARGLSEALAELLRQPFEPVPGSPPSRLLEGERIVHIADMAELARQAAVDARAQAVAEDGFRTGLFVPLRKDVDLLGYIVAVRREVRLYSEKEIALLENFAAQAVIAMENARLLTETREALEQQTATAEVLQVINSSPGDLAPVFDAMLERATRLCAPAFGVLFTWDGERFHRVAWRGGSEEAIGASPGAVIPPPGSPGYRLVQGENCVSIADLAADEIARTTPVHRFGARSYVTVALRKDGRLLGGIAVYRQEVRPFTDKEIALLQNFAAQAVIAMENTRLITETREALEQQTATAEVLQVINSSPGDLAPVFDAILEKAHSLCGADYGSLLTYDGDRFWPIARHGGSERLAEALREGIRPWAGAGMDEIVRGASFAHIHDMAELAKMAPDDAPPRTLVEIGGIRTQLVVPLRKDNALLGVITANRREVRPFSDKQIALLQNFAAQAVIAMENARLLSETREALEQQTATAEVLRVINSSPGDLKPVFEAILIKAHTLCGAAHGHLTIYEGGNFRAVATHAVPEHVAEVLRQPVPAGGLPQKDVRG